MVSFRSSRKASRSLSARSVAEWAARDGSSSTIADPTDDIDMESASAFASNVYDPTPTHTTSTLELDDPFNDGEKPFTPDKRTSDCPVSGGTYLIRDPSSGYVIALKNGELMLLREEGALGSGKHECRGAYWQCVENQELWLGFKNAVSAEFIGHDNSTLWKFRATKKHHRAWEWFTVRQVEGGHELLVKHYDGFRAMKTGPLRRERVPLEDYVVGKVAQWDWDKNEVRAMKRESGYGPEHGPLVRDLLVSGPGMHGTAWQFVRID